MTGRQILMKVCRKVTTATLLALALGPIALLWVFSAAPMATATPNVADGPAVAAVTTTSPLLTVSLTTITPTIAVPKAPIRIIASVHNASSVPIDSPVARALLGQRPLTSRQAVSDWVTPTAERSLTTEQSLTEVAHASLGKTLAAGAIVRFTLTVPASAISHRDSFAILPLRVEVVGTSIAKRQVTKQARETAERGELNTFLPALAAVKAFEPLSIAWVIPLTLDPDPALHGVDSPARTAAWNEAIGPGSRVDKLIQGTEDSNVTWAIDPAILGPQQGPTAADGSAEPSPTSSASKAPTPDSAAISDPVIKATTALASRLRAAAPRHTLWSLPYADPDLAALSPLASGNQDLAPLISHPTTLDTAVGPARADIAWPVEGTLTPGSETQLRRAFTEPGLAAAVTSASTLSNRNGSASNASRKSSTGLPLLAYDEALSRTVAQTSVKANGAATIQRFLADSMALLGERPGTRNRSVLIAEPRGFAGDPTVLRSLFAAIANAPWLNTTTTDLLLKTSQGMAPEAPSVMATSPPSPTTDSPVSGENATNSDPLSPGATPLTSEQLEAIPDTLSAITGIDSILDHGQQFSARWTDAQKQQVSTRWRGHPDGPDAIEAATAAAISTISRSVTVAPSSVNFFADQGVLQVTVVNALAVPVHDVHLTLTPAQPRLRIEEQPGPLKIGARSRANVPLQVTAIAAGLVPIDAVLTTGNGTPLGQSARVNVRVQPTNTWIYRVLGGMAGLVLVLGTYRSLRRGSTRASQTDAQEPVFND